VILAAPLSAIGRDLFVYIYRRLEGESPAAARLAAEVRAEPTPARRNKQPAA
jgi:hypothetical protein